jgi:hypothetical protein
MLLPKFVRNSFLSMAFKLPPIPIQCTFIALWTTIHSVVDLLDMPSCYFEKEVLKRAKSPNVNFIQGTTETLILIRIEDETYYHE